MVSSQMVMLRITSDTEAGMRLFHVSDLHLKAVHRENEVVRAKLSGIRKQFGPGDLLVVTGDVTDDGTETQYRHALEMLMPFQGRIALCPGNHDFGALGNIYSKECVRRWSNLCAKLGAETLTRVGINGILTGQILSVDSCLRTGSIVDFAQGKVGWWQRRTIRSFGKQMRDARYTSIVILHHNPLYQSWFCRLQDAKQFFESTLGVVDYVFMGHEHTYRHHWYPMNLPASQAQTHYYAAPALHKADSEPTIISLKS